MNSAHYRVTAETVVGPDIDLDQEIIVSRSGQRLTEAAADAISASRGGRPSLGAGGSSPQVAFRIPSELRERAERLAAVEGRSLSAIAREQLERYLDEHAA